MTERGTSVSTRIGAYGTWASDWTMRRWISVAVVSSSTPGEAAQAVAQLLRRDVGDLRRLALEARRAQRALGHPLAPGRGRLALGVGKSGGADLDDDRPAVGDDRLAVAVDDVAARGLDALLADLVVVRLGEVLVAGEDLQVPEPEEDDREERERDPAQEGDPPGELGADRRAAISDGIDHEREVRLDPCVRRPCCSGESAAEEDWRRRPRGCWGSERESQRRAIA